MPQDAAKPGAAGRRQTLRTLVDLVDRLADGGERPALVAFRRKAVDTWSYGDLAHRVAEMAGALAGAGLAAGDRVVLLAENRPEWVAACLAAIKAGLVVVPVDVQQGGDTLRHILQDSGARLAFVGAAAADRLEEVAEAPRAVLLDEDDDARSWRRLAAAPGALPPLPEPDAAAALFYTSGTTGAPKGVPLSHGNLVFELNALVAAGVAGAGDRLLLPLPLHHVFPFVVGMLAPLSLGLPVVMPRAMTGGDIATALREGRATLIVGVPRLYGAFLDGLRARIESLGRLAGGTFRALLAASTWLRRRIGVGAGALFAPLRWRIAPELRLLVSGGAALDPELAYRLEGLGWRVATGYGLTETAPILTWNRPGRARLDSAGEPLPGIELRIEPVALGEGEQAPDEAAGQAYGEILARGPGVFAGYRGLPKETREAFTEDGWFRTGDLGYLDRDGYLRIVGRAKTMLVTEGGKNIQPDTLEEAYLASPEIREIAVLQKDGRLVALVVPEARVAGRGEEAAQAVERALRERARALPSYQRIADYAIASEPIPRTRLGKPRRHLLVEQFDRAKQAKAPAEGPSGPASVEAMSAEDRRLLQSPAARAVWDWLAERHADRPLAPDSSPQLDLGIDSVEWLNVTLEIGQRTGVELAEEAIARVETVRDLLREVADAAAAGERFDAALLDDPEAYLSAEQKRWLEPTRGVRFVFASLLHQLDRALMRGVFRLRVDGRDRLPDGQALFAPTHGSLLDPFALAAALGRDRLARIYWIGDAGMAFGNPLTRAVSRLAQAFPIDAERGFVSGVALAAAALKRGHSLVWFPEGRRASEDRVQSFMPGIGMLLDRYRVPVVPVIIHGAHRAMPPGRWIPRPTRIRIVVGEALDPGELARGGAGETDAQRITAALHDHVEALFERTRGG